VPDSRRQRHSAPAKLPKQLEWDGKRPSSEIRTGSLGPPAASMPLQCSNVDSGDTDLGDQLERLLEEQHSRLTQFLDKRLLKLEHALQLQYTDAPSDPPRLPKQTPGVEQPSKKSVEFDPTAQTVEARRLGPRPIRSPQSGAAAESGSVLLIDVDDVICDVRSQSDFEENDARQDAERHLHWSSDDTVVVKSIPLAMEELKVRAEWELDIAGMAGTAPARKTKSVKSIVRETAHPRLLRGSAKGSRASSNDSDSWTRRLSYLEWCWRETVIPPQSLLEICWDVMACMVVLYDIFEVPIQVFEPDNSSGFVVLMAWVSQIFWNADVLVSFRTGYIDKEDHPVLEPNAVARHYLKTWFGFDLLIVSVDWLLYFVGASSTDEGDESASPMIAKAGKTFKVFRAVRTLKMLRLLKMRRALSIMEESAVSCLAGCTTPIVGIAKFLFVIILVCHFLCSLWYWAGSSSGDEGWVPRFGVDHLPFWDRYLMTFHWSLSQFGVGTSAVYGVTAFEYSCNIFILVCGLLVSALLVSSVTNTFSVLQQQTAEHYHQMWLLRRYCLDNDFPQSLSRRITKHVERKAVDRGGKIQTVDVRLLEVLSRPLYTEVMFYVHLPPLSTHAFFGLLCRDDSYTMRQVATEATRELTLAENDLVFIRGSLARAAFNVIDGLLSYEKEDLAGETVQSPAWISEQVLWAHWVHRGHLGTKTACRILALDAAKFCEEVRCQSDTYIMVQQYALHRVEALQDMNPKDLTDMLQPDTQLGDFKLLTINGDLSIPELTTRREMVRQPSWAQWSWRWLEKVKGCCCAVRQKAGAVPVSVVLSDEGKA